MLLSPILLSTESTLAFVASSNFNVTVSPDADAVNPLSPLTLNSMPPDLFKSCSEVEVESFVADSFILLFSILFAIESTAAFVASSNLTVTSVPLAVVVKPFVPFTLNCKPPVLSNC